MPNALTHYYIGETIFDGLDAKTKQRISGYKKEYTLGCLGPDIIMGLMLEKDPLKRDAGENLHTDFVYAGLCNTANFLRENDDKALYAYYLGFLTHYAADSTIHPYVYYYIENRMREKYDPILNNCLHTIVETEMDTYVGHYLLKGKGANSFYRFSTSKKRRDVVKKYFLEVNKNIFRLFLDGRDVNKSCFYFKLMMFLCQRHKNGKIRFMIMEQIDKYLRAEHLLMSALRPRGLDKRYDYLNMERLPYPAIYQDEKSGEVAYSFPEMLDIAKEKGLKLIALANSHISEGKTLPISEFELNYNGGKNKEYIQALENGIIDL